MDNTKPWYQSTTIWANIVAIASLGLVAFHINVGPADQAAIVTDIEGVVGVVSSLLGIWGRIRATAMIGAKS